MFHKTLSTLINFNLNTREVKTLTNEGEKELGS